MEFSNPAFACLARTCVGLDDLVALLAIIGPLDKRITKTSMATVGDGITTLAVLLIVVRLA